MTLAVTALVVVVIVLILAALAMAAWAAVRRSIDLVGLWLYAAFVLVLLLHMGLH